MYLRVGFILQSVSLDPDMCLAMRSLSAIAECFLSCACGPIINSGGVVLYLSALHSFRLFEVLVSIFLVAFAFQDCLCCHLLIDACPLGGPVF